VSPQLIQYESVEAMTADPWNCDLTRGDVQCKYVTENGDDGFLCCMYREGHEAERAHHVCYLRDSGTNRWIYRPDLTIFEMQRYSQ
jgi:hypothetical protein